MTTFTTEDRINADNCMNCHLCLKDKVDEQGWPLLAQRMILCPTCSNKRCPQATDHRLACTNSNEPGQLGSCY